MSLNWHMACISRGIYPFTPSLTHLLVRQEDKGQELPPRALAGWRGHSWGRWVLTRFLQEQAWTLAGGSQAASQGYFCWCAVLDVTCCGRLSFAIHMVPFPPFCTFLGLQGKSQSRVKSNMFNLLQTLSSSIVNSELCLEFLWKINHNPVWEVLWSYI